MLTLLQKPENRRYLANILSGASLGGGLGLGYAAVTTPPTIKTKIVKQKLPTDWEKALKQELSTSEDVLDTLYYHGSMPGVGYVPEGTYTTTPATDPRLLITAFPSDLSATGHDLLTTHHDKWKELWKAKNYKHRPHALNKVQAQKLYRILKLLAVDN
jgi:hypothetical protein